MLVLTSSSRMVSLSRKKSLQRLMKNMISCSEGCLLMHVMFTCSALQCKYLPYPPTCTRTLGLKDFHYSGHHCPSILLWLLLSIHAVFAMAPSTGRCLVQLRDVPGFWEDVSEIVGCPYLLHSSVGHISLGQNAKLSEFPVLLAVDSVELN